MAFYKSKTFKYWKNFLIGMGAAFIIIGALFKILHLEGANTILTIAMLGEAAIFALSALIPPDNEYYWEKLYPGLDNHSGKMQAINTSRPIGGGTTASLDTALAKAGVNQDLIKRLGGHLNSLGDNLQQLSQVTSATSATSEYSQKAKAAADALGKVTLAYEDAANVAKDLAVATDGTKDYHVQIKAASDNLAKLNTAYELELTDTNNHLKALNQFYGNLTSAMNNLNESVEDTKIYKEQMAGLAQNLSSLNNVYGNMLTAMSMGAKK